jgi:hypothetical protein
MNCLGMEARGYAYREVNLKADSRASWLPDGGERAAFSLQPPELEIQRCH